MKTAAAVLMGRRREALFTYGASPLMHLSILSFLQFLQCFTLCPVHIFHDDSDSYSINDEKGGSWKGSQQ